MSDQEFNQWVREVEFMGIPGDILAHFGIGALIGWVIYIVVGSDKKAVIAILIASVAKELFFDIKANLDRGEFFEPTKDILVSIAGALLILFIFKRPFK